jgi:hypothetical protein
VPTREGVPGSTELPRSDPDTAQEEHNNPARVIADGFWMDTDVVDDVQLADPIDTAGHVTVVEGLTRATYPGAIAEHRKPM